MFNLKVLLGTFIGLTLVMAPSNVSYEIVPRFREQLLALIRDKSVSRKGPKTFLQIFPQNFSLRFNLIKNFNFTAH